MSQSVITIFEDKKQKVTLNNSQQNDILSFRSIIGNQNLTLDFDGSLQVMHYVGFISKGNTCLQILPKIYEQSNLETEDEKRQSMRVLLNLLRVSEFSKILDLPEQSSVASESDLFELFVSIFANKIMAAYSKQTNREYVEVTENSQFIRGKIDFSQNIIKNPLRKDRHIVCYHSFEQDNLINNVIKTVALKLLLFTRSSENKKLLKKAMIYLDDANNIVLTKALIDSAKFNRLNETFKPVYDMAKMFFLNLTPESYCGKDTVCSFLIPVNRLFEYYLYKILDRLTGYEAKYQNEKTFGRLVNGKSLFQIRPDILLYKQKLEYIIDAKYKNPKFENGYYAGISQGDVYQVFSYAHSYGCKQVALIYPRFDDLKTAPQTIELVDSVENVKLTIVSLDLKTATVEENCEYLQTVLS